MSWMTMLHVLLPLINPWWAELLAAATATAV
jgi:hypothetical protein